MDREFFHILSPREQKVLEMRGEGKTLEQISEEFCVTKERIRQIEAKAIRKIRDARKEAEAKHQ